MFREPSCRISKNIHRIISFSTLLRMIMELRLDTILSSVVPYPVDVKILINSPLSFTYNAMKNGIPVFVTNEDVRVDFIENTLNKKR